MGSTKLFQYKQLLIFLAISKNIGIMKLLSFATVIAPTLANLNTIEKKWEDMTVDELRIECKKFQDEAGNYVDGTPDVCLGIRGTAFDGQMLLFSSATPKYGCWCDLENSLKRASNGDPVNDLDRACRDLHHNYNCITIEDPSCNPRTLDASVGEYNLPISALSSLTTAENACAANNLVDSCAYNTCVAEAYFLRETVRPVYAGNDDWISMWNDATNQHSPEGTFDFADRCGVSSEGSDKQCPPEGCGGPSDYHAKQCCGPFPNKVAFFTHRAMCCSDVVSPLGTC